MYEFMNNRAQYTHDELLESCEIYREICHSQMGDNTSKEVAS